MTPRGEVDREVDVVLVVVAYNSAPVLPGLLDSLPAGCGDVPWRLVVVDNASTDDSVELVRRSAPGATVVETGRNAGYAAGINAGVAAAGPFTHLLVLNPDVRLDPGCLPTLVAACAPPDVGIAVPRLRDRRGALIESMRREPTTLRVVGDLVLGARRAGRHPRLGEMVTDPALYERPQRPDWAEGSTQLITAECWRRFGPWDETYFLYSEETDFDLRARDGGLGTTYEPAAGATHLEGGSSTSPALWPLLVANKVLWHRRRHGRVRTAPFHLALLLRETSRALLGRAQSRAAARVLLSPRRMGQDRGPAWLAGPADTASAGS